MEFLKNGIGCARRKKEILDSPMQTAFPMIMMKSEIWKKIEKIIIFQFMIMILLSKTPTQRLNEMQYTI